MVSQRVRDMAAASALGGTEKFYADDGSSNVQVTANQIATFAQTGFTSGTQNYLNVKDFGALGNGLADDSPAIQDCFDEAFGPVSSPNGNANRFLNRAVYFPAGSYLLVATINGKSWEAPHIFGDGKTVTTLSAQVGGGIFLNGCRFGTFENFSISKTGDASQIAFDLNWDNGGDVPLTGNLFSGVAFGGNGTGIGCAIGRDGYMGSENLFLNCTFANLTTGLKCYNQNALDNSVIGGDAFSCTEAAFSSHQGQIAMVIGGSYAGNGYDYKMGGVPSDLYMAGIRSESVNFFYSPNSNAGITFIGIEHTGNGTFIDAPSQAGVPITCIGCDTAGSIEAGIIHWIGSNDTPTTSSAAVTIHADRGGYRHVVRMDASPGPSTFPDVIAHNIGIGASSNITFRPQAGFTQSFVVRDAFQLRIICEGTEGILTPTGLVAGGATPRVDVASSTPGSSITLTCIRSGASVDPLYAVLAMTGTWSFTPV